MSKIVRIGNILAGSEVETEDDLVSAMCALWQEASKIEPPKYIPVGQWVLDAIDEALAEQRVACDLCSGAGYVYLVDEDPNDTSGFVKERRDCPKCNKRRAETN